MASTSSIVETIDIAVPVRTAYNQWTQFEEFPQFMQSVESVKQLDDATLHWVAEIGGRQKEWTAKITEQIPDKRIAWTSIDGAHNAGVVTFHRLSDETCRVTLQLEYQPEGALEAVGDAIGLMTWNTRENLERFKSFIEQRGEETGGFRGEIQSPEDRREGTHHAQHAQSSNFATRMPDQGSQQGQSSGMSSQQGTGGFGKQRSQSSGYGDQSGMTGTQQGSDFGRTSKQQQQGMGMGQQGSSLGSQQQQQGMTSWQQGQGGEGISGGEDSPAEDIMSHQNEPASAQRGSSTLASKTTSRDRRRQ